MSFKIEAGTTTALVGRCGKGKTMKLKLTQNDLFSSGSGKTTVAKLLIRMFDVKKGKIMFGGEDVKSYTQTSLRQAMGVVPQDTVLFNDTIK